MSVLNRMLAVFLFLAMANPMHAFAQDIDPATAWIVSANAQNLPRLPRVVDVPVDQAISEAERNLIVFAAQGNLGKVKELLDQGVRSNARDADGSRALHAAVAEGHWEMSRRLMRQGADPNLAGVNGVYPLGIAVQRGHPKLIELLLKNEADIEQRDKLGNTPLVTALLLERNEVAGQLIGAGARLDVKSGDKRCIAELAAAHANEEILQLILSRGGTGACH